MTVGLVLLNVLVFLAMGWQTGATPGQGNSAALAWGANFGPATQHGEWWRLLTAQFIHFGPLHLVANMWALWDVGRLLERLLGRPRFLGVYLAAGAGGNLVALLVHGNQLVSAGASGAVFGLYGALIIFLCSERRRMDPLELRWMLSGSVVFVVLMFVVGLLVPGIDNAAHGGGLLFGALLGGMLLPSPPGGAQATARVRGAAALLLLGLGGMLLAMPKPEYRYQEELQTRAAIARFAAQERVIASRWDALLYPEGAPASFDQMAGASFAQAIEAQVSAPYQSSFEQLAAVHPVTPVPSAPALFALQTYAVQRRAAAVALTAGLRDGDAVAVQEALASAEAAYRQVHTSASPGSPVSP